MTKNENPAPTASADPAFDSAVAAAVASYLSVLAAESFSRSAELRAESWNNLMAVGSERYGTERFWRAFGELAPAE